MQWWQVKVYLHCDVSKYSRDTHGFVAGIFVRKNPIRSVHSFQGSASLPLQAVSQAAMKKTNFPMNQTG